MATFHNNGYVSEDIEVEEGLARRITNGETTYSVLPAWITDTVAYCVVRSNPSRAEIFEFTPTYLSVGLACDAVRSDIRQETEIEDLLAEYRSLDGLHYDGRGEGVLRVLKLARMRSTQVALLTDMIFALRKEIAAT